MRFRPLLARSTVAKTSETQSADLLTNYLVELDRRGWDLDEFLRHHSDVSVALRNLLRVADRIRRAPAPVPSEAFRQRSRRRLAAAMAQQPTRRRWYRFRAAWRHYGPLVAPVAAGLLMVFGLGGAWSASATALPSSPLYPAKLVFERAELITAISPDRRVEVHLAIARERLREAAVEQQQGDISAAQDLIAGSDAEVAQAQAAVKTYSPPTAIATAVASSVAQVNDERQQIATRVVAVPLITPLPMAGGSDRTAAAAASIGSPTAVASGPARTDSPGHGGNNRDGNQDTHQQPGKDNPKDSQPHRPQGNGGDNGAGKGDDGGPVARDATAPTPTAGSDATSSPSVQADRLIHTLINQALHGDPTSQQTASHYLALIKSEHSDAKDWRSLLASHRALIEKAIPTAPTNTRPVLASVLRELNHEIGPSDPGQNGPDESSTNSPAGTESSWVFASSSPPEKPAPASNSPPSGQSQVVAQSTLAPTSSSTIAHAKPQGHPTPDRPAPDHSKGSDSKSSGRLIGR